MDVQLYVYDLSRGMARQYSQMITGVQIDAVYHTSIVFNNVEYFFGQGIHRKIPGSTHHGRPMKIVDMGQTDLPVDVVEEYIESLEEIYTPESYDLFLHNCNNFSQDLAMFLVGKSIPEEIKNLPETFLRTPMGQMLRGQLDQSMRTMTQAPDAVSGENVSRRRSISKPASRAVRNGNAIPSITNGTAHKVILPVAIINAQPPPDAPGRVHNITSLSELDRLLSSASQSCAVIFFTSATCPPCKICYPTYDELAAEAGTSSGAKLIKIDISASPSAHAVAQRYSIRATPTFITFLKGQKQEEWAGADPTRLRGNIRLLLQMAKPPQHQHAKLRLPTFQRPIERPTLYTRMPPLEKLLAKLGTPFSQHESVQALVDFIKTRDAKGATEAALPNLHDFSVHVKSTFADLPQGTHFALIDLVRIAASDSRVASFLATEHECTTLSTLLGSVQDGDFTSAPYNIQSVSLQLACNLFSSNVFQEQIFRPESAASSHETPDLKEKIETLAAQCLLSQHLNARAMAAALVYNLASYTHNARTHATQTSPPSAQDNEGEGETCVSDDLAAALLESITSLPSLPPPAAPSAGNLKDTLHALLLALGMLLYAAPAEDMLWDLCRAMDLRDMLRDLGKRADLKAEPLVKEVGEELLGKGGF
jgi:thiol-disulfide isomerase/thioredoxin